jgi:beta-sarcoglycan
MLLFCLSAGYVPVHESSLNKTGLRGRKTYAFWTLVGLLSVLAWANMILTALIFQVLRLGHGLESLEIIPEQSLVKFFGVSDLGKVYKPDGVIEGFREEPMSVEGDRGSLVFDVEDSKGRARNSMNLSHNGTWVMGVQSFEIKSRSQTIFSTDSPSFSLPQGVHNVETDRIESGRVTSGVNEKLTLRADIHAKLKGNEGTRVEGREIVWSADQVVSLESSNGSIILGGKNGILLDVKSIPIVGEAGHQLSAQYKVTVLSS